MVSRCLLVLAVLAGLLIAPASSFTDGPFTQPAAAAPTGHRGRHAPLPRFSAAADVPGVTSEAPARNSAAGSQ